MLDKTVQLKNDPRVQKVHLLTDTEKFQIRRSSSPSYCKSSQLVNYKVSKNREVLEPNDAMCDISTAVIMDIIAR